MPSELILMLQSTQPERPLLFVADGDRRWRESVGIQARELGYEVESFGRIKDLAARVQSVLPHILVMDGLLPDGNGIDFLEAFLPRIDGERPHIIFASAVFRKFEHYSRLRILGVERILGKPCAPDTLKAELLAHFPILQDTDIEETAFEAAEVSGSFPSDWRVA